MFVPRAIYSGEFGGTRCDENLPRPGSGKRILGERMVLDFEGKDRRGRGTRKLVYGISKFRTAVCCRSRQFRRAAQVRVSSVLTTAIEVRVLRFLASEIRIRCITLRSSKSLKRELEI